MAACFHPIEIAYKNAQDSSDKLLRPERQSFLVPCGRCPACWTRKQNEWAIRILYESRYSTCPSYFLTLTYDDKNVPVGDCCFTLDKSAPSDFMKKLRVMSDRKGYGKLRFFACGEYGDIYKRPHYHLVLFGFNGSKSLLQEVCERVWHQGFVDVSMLTVRRAKYVAKYVCKANMDKMDDPDCYSGCVPPFAVMSRRPAIGSALLEDTSLVNSLKKKQDLVIYDDQGTPYVLPRIYRQKLFSKSFLDKRQQEFSDSAISQHEFHLAKDDYSRYMTDSENIKSNTEALFYKRLRESIFNKSFSKL